MTDTKTARAATMDELVQSVVPNFLTPVPHPETLRAWFNAARIPRFKSNPTAKRGGGRVYYQVAAVEKLLRGRMLAPTRN
jgi:trehalose utilization protein